MPPTNHVLLSAALVTMVLVSLTDCDFAFFHPRDSRSSTYQASREHIHDHGHIHGVRSRAVENEDINADFVYKDEEYQLRAAMEQRAVEQRAKDQRVRDLQQQAGKSAVEIDNCVGHVCEHVPGYPADRIRELMEGNDTLHNFIKQSEIDLFENRFNLDPDEETLCRFTRRTMFPEKAKNVDDQDRFIVNVGEYKQGIEVDVCSEGDGKGKCAFSSRFPDGVISYCKQKYTKKKLVAMKEDQNVGIELFEMPSCCVCVYKKNKHP